MNKEKHYISFWDLPNDLKSHLFTKCLLCATGYVSSIAFYLCTGMLREYFLLVIAISLYTLYIILLIFKALSGKIYVYEGICEKKHGKRKTIKIPIILSVTSWSYCYLVLRISQHDKEVRVKVPCAYNFNADEGSVVRVYAHESRIRHKSSNIYCIHNPILISIVAS